MTSRLPPAEDMGTAIAQQAGDAAGTGVNILPGSVCRALLVLKGNLALHLGSNQCLGLRCENWRSPPRGTGSAVRFLRFLIALILACKSCEMM